jgi:hypothetical protein
VLDAVEIVHGLMHLLAHNVQQVLDLRANRRHDVLAAAAEGLQS